MEIVKTIKDSTLTIGLIGRLDTTTSPAFETIIKEELSDIKTLIIDLKDLEYVSSAGLRVLLLAQKTMNNQGAMSILNANDNIKEIFEITGFIDILSLE